MHERIVILNRDIAGFFTSIPHSRILTCIGHLIERIQARHARPWQQAKSWTVFMKGVRRKCIRGVWTEPGAVHVPVDLVLDIVRHALEHGYCQIGQLIYRQRQGGPIGFPISAAACTIVVMEAENDFLASLRAIPRNWSGCRYVDNLLTAHVVQHGVHSLPPELLDLGFYGAPMKLEHEPQYDFLGCEVKVQDNRLYLDFLVPGIDELSALIDQGCEPRLTAGLWRYRTPVAAGSSKRAVTGILGKLHNAARFPFPPIRSRVAIVKLLMVAVSLGFESKTLSRVVTQHASKYKLVYSPGFTQRVKAHMSSVKALTELQILLGDLEADFHSA